MKTTGRYRCAGQDCREIGFFDYDSRRDADRHAEELRRRGGWRCTRHTQPEEVLSVASPERTTVLTARKSLAYPDLESTFWIADDERSGSRFIHGPGFKAWTKDFPEGTRLVVTARLELPTSPDQRATPGADGRSGAEGER